MISFDLIARSGPPWPSLGAAWLMRADGGGSGILPSARAKARGQARADSARRDRVGGVERGWCGQRGQVHLRQSLHLDAHALLCAQRVERATRNSEPAVESGRLTDRG